MTRYPAPATVRIVEMFTGAVRTMPFEQVPEAMRWVYLRGGLAVDTPEQADEIVPVAEVRRITLDDAGELVAADRATHVRVDECAPDGRVLRWTNMVREGR